MFQVSVDSLCSLGDDWVAAVTSVLEEKVEDVSPVASDPLVQPLTVDADEMSVAPVSSVPPVFVSSATDEPLLTDKVA